MAYLNSEKVVTDYIEDIQNLVKKENFVGMNEKVTAMTKYLFTHSDLIYSNINNEFEKSGLARTLIDILPTLNEQYKRDTLRLLNIFLRTNNNLRNEVSRNRNFIEFLLSRISSKDAWNNIEKIKYFVNIVSYLLINKEVNEKYETKTIRDIVRNILEDYNTIESDSRKVLCMMFCSSIGINGKVFSNEPTDICAYEKVFNKDVISSFIEIIRDYIYEFKQFYEKPLNDQINYLKFCLKANYSFDQVCICISYYARLNENIRMNIFQSGLYDLLSLIFLIKDIPTIFINSSIEVLSIPCLDHSLKERFKKEHRNIIDKFRTFLSTDDLVARRSMEELLTNFECNPNSLSKPLSHVSCQTDILITFTPPSSTCSSHFNDLWGSLDVENWLTENNLDHCREKFSSLTGRGLNQLKILMNEPCGKFQVIELLTQKLEINLISVLELLGALENFEYK